MDHIAWNEWITSLEPLDHIAWNTHLVWTKSADKILEKVNRARQALAVASA